MSSYNSGVYWKWMKNKHGVIYNHDKRVYRSAIPDPYNSRNVPFNNKNLKAGADEKSIVYNHWLKRRYVSVKASSANENLTVHYWSSVNWIHRTGDQWILSQRASKAEGVPIAWRHHVWMSLVWLNAQSIWVHPIKLNLFWSCALIFIWYYSHCTYNAPRSHNSFGLCYKHMHCGIPNNRNRVSKLFTTQ